jgi:hypothetical protein
MSPIYIKTEGFVARCKLLKSEQVRVLVNENYLQRSHPSIISRAMPM